MKKHYCMYCKKAISEEMYNSYCKPSSYRLLHPECVNPYRKLKISDWIKRKLPCDCRYCGEPVNSVEECVDVLKIGYNAKKIMHQKCLEYKMRKRECKQLSDKELDEMAEEWCKANPITRYNVELIAQAWKNVLSDMEDSLQVGNRIRRGDM